jgi:hypothetical protein
MGSLLRQKISVKDIYQLKTILTKLKTSKQLSEAYYFVEALTILNKSNIRVPYQISELKLEDNKLKIEVSDLFDKDANVEVKIEKISTLDDTIIENVEMKQLDKTNTYLFDATEEKDNFQSGSLNIKLSIQPKNKTETQRELKITRFLKFETDVSIKNFVLNVNDKRGIFFFFNKKELFQHK